MIYFCYVFVDLYTHTGEVLGSGAYASVKTYKSNMTQKQYAVKVSSLENLYFIANLLRYIEQKVKNKWKINIVLYFLGIFVFIAS